MAMARPARFWPTRQYCVKGHAVGSFGCIQMVTDDTKNDNNTDALYRAGKIRR